MDWFITVVRAEGSSVRDWEFAPDQTDTHSQAQILLIDGNRERVKEEQRKYKNDDDNRHHQPWLRRREFDDSEQYRSRNAQDNSQENTRLSVLIRVHGKRIRLTAVS